MPGTGTSQVKEEKCIFCKIGRGEVPAELLYRDDAFFAIRDIQPKVPVHVLIIPFDHVGALAGEPQARFQDLGGMIAAAASVAKQLGVEEEGYRLVINQGPQSGQEVPHLHLHLLAGRRLGPMG